MIAPCAALGPRVVPLTDRNLDAILGGAPISLTALGRLQTVSGRGYWVEGRAWVEGALAAAPEPTPARATALWGAGAFGWLLGEQAAARARFDEGVRIAQALGDPPELAAACYPLLGMLSDGGHPDARARLQQMLVVAGAAGDRWLLAATRFTLGQLAGTAGDLATAHTQLAGCVELCRAVGDRWLLAQAFNGLGDVARRQGDDAQAAMAYAESLHLFEALAIKDGQAGGLHNLAYLAQHQGDAQRAAALFQAALRRFRELGDRRGMAECLVGLAGVMGAGGQAERAAQLVGAAERLLEVAGTAISVANQSDYMRTLGAIRGLLGEGAFAAARTAGRTLAWEQVVAQALDDPVPATRPAYS